MRRLTEEALQAGAFGFTTSRTNSHKTPTGELVPGRYAEEAELLGIGRALGAAGARRLRHEQRLRGRGARIRLDDAGWRRRPAGRSGSC